MWKERGTGWCSRPWIVHWLSSGCAVPGTHIDVAPSPSPRPSTGASNGPTFLLPTLPILATAPQPTLDSDYVVALAQTRQAKHLEQAVAFQQEGEPARYRGEAVVFMSEAAHGWTVCFPG